MLFLISLTKSRDPSLFVKLFWDVLSFFYQLLFDVSRSRHFIDFPITKKFKDYSSISFLSLPCKNEDSSNCFNLKNIHPFSSININFYTVNVIKEALSISSVSSSSLILNPRNLKDISVPSLCFMVCKIIRTSCPSAFPKIQDLRKLLHLTYSCHLRIWNWYFWDLLFLKWMLCTGQL